MTKTHSRVQRGVKVYEETHKKIAFYSEKLRWTHQDFVAEAIAQLEERVKREGVGCLFHDLPSADDKK